MHVAEANVKAILAGEDVGLGAPLKDTSAFAMTTESLSADYRCTPPACSTSSAPARRALTGAKKTKRKNNCCAAPGRWPGPAAGAPALCAAPAGNNQAPMAAVRPVMGLLSAVRRLISAR